MADAPLYERDPNLTFGEPTQPSGKFSSGLLSLFINPIANALGLKPKADPRRTVQDSTGTWWREVDAGSGIYYKFGNKSAASVNLGGSSSGGGSGGYSGYTPVYSPRSGTKPPPGDILKPPPIGPYPKKNIFFPMLANAYTAPGARNLKRLFPKNPYGGGMLLRGAPSRYDQAIFPGMLKENAKGKTKLIMTKDLGRPDYSGRKGLLYQPWTTQYQQAFVRPDIWNYKPVQLRVGFPQRYNPFGPLDLSYEPPPDTPDDSGESSSGANPNL